MPTTPRGLPLPPNSARISDFAKIVREQSLTVDADLANMAGRVDGVLPPNQVAEHWVTLTANADQTITSNQVTKATLAGASTSSAAASWVGTGANASSVVIGVTGRYLISFAVNWDSNNSGGRRVLVYANGVEAPAAGSLVRPADNFNTLQSLTLRPLALTAGDVIDLRVHQYSGSGTAVRLIGAPRTSLHIERLR